MKTISQIVATVSLIAPSYVVALPAWSWGGHDRGGDRHHHGGHDDWHHHAPFPKPPLPPKHSSPVVSPTLPSLTTPKCTLMVEPPKPTEVDTLTCTKYASTETVTAYTECNGCELHTFSFGPGPVIPCSTKITLPVTTDTVTFCSLKTDGPPPVPTVTPSPPFSIPSWPFPIPVSTATDFPPSFPLPSFLSGALHPHPHPPFHQAEKKDIKKTEEVEGGLDARDLFPINTGQQTVPFATGVIISNLVNAVMWSVSAALKGHGLSTAGILPTTITDPLALIISGAMNPFGGTPLGPSYTSPFHDPGTNPGSENGQGNNDGGNGGKKHVVKPRTPNAPPVMQSPLEMIQHYLEALKEFLSGLPQNYKNSNEGKIVMAAMKQFIAAVNKFAMSLEKGVDPKKAAAAFVKAIKAIGDELNKAHTQGGGK